MGELGVKLNQGTLTDKEEKELKRLAYKLNNTDLGRDKNIFEKRFNKMDDDRKIKYYASAMYPKLSWLSRNKYKAGAGALVGAAAGYGIYKKRHAIKNKLSNLWNRIRGRKQY